MKKKSIIGIIAIVVIAVLAYFGYQTATKGKQASESTASSDKPVLKVATTEVSFPGSYIKMIMEI